MVVTLDQRTPVVEISFLDVSSDYRFEKYHNFRNVEKEFVRANVRITKPESIRADAIPKLKVGQLSATLGPKRK